MSTLTTQLTPRERELGAIISAYNEVTEQLKLSHERLGEEVRRLREELAAKNKELHRRERLAALGELAAGVAHEIRNPLGGIHLFASLLADDLADRPKELGLVRKISKGVTRLESIVSDILAFGRPADPAIGPVALGAVARETAELAEPVADPGRVTIEIADGLNGIELEADPALVQRALLNLVLNAVEAAQAGDEETGRVEIGVGAMSDDLVTVTVADNGLGVPAELMDRVFNPFFTTKDSGTGLGLSIVHQVAEALGGGVRAANRPGGGAMFSLTLPRRARTWRSAG